jgi:predicted kinase
MQKTMIALWGIGNLGKTTTIRLAYETLRKEAKVIDPGRRARKEVIGAILEIDGVKVGFASQGDLAEILEELLAPLIEAGCLVIICATHTRGGTVETVNQLASQAQPPFKLVWIPKAGPQVDHADGNQKKADELISAIRTAVAETRQAELVEA